METTEVGNVYLIRTGHGYWRTDRYPIGGDFHRVPKDGTSGLHVTVTRTFEGCDPKLCHGTNTEGITADGVRLAFDRYGAELVTGSRA